MRYTARYMGKQTLVMFFGVWVAVQSFLGLPLAWDRVIFALLGVAILGLGILLRYDAMMHLRSGKHAETFVENEPEKSQSEAPDDGHEARTE